MLEAPYMYVHECSKHPIYVYHVQKLIHLRILVFKAPYMHEQTSAAGAPASPRPASSPPGAWGLYLTILFINKFQKVNSPTKKID